METPNTHRVRLAREADAQSKLDKRFGDMEKRIADLEEFLEVARIPDAQEWRRKELRGESL